MTVVMVQSGRHSECDQNQQFAVTSSPYMNCIKQHAKHAKD